MVALLCTVAVGACPVAVACSESLLTAETLGGDEPLAVAKRAVALPKGLAEPDRKAVAVGSFVAVDTTVALLLSYRDGVP